MMFVVREIDSEDEGKKVEWKWITFKDFAQHSSYVFGSEETNMQRDRVLLSKYQSQDSWPLIGSQRRTCETLSADSQL